MTPLPNVRPLEAQDFDAWLLLWNGYNAFYRNEVTAEITQNTFRRLHEGADGFFGMIASSDGDLVGLAHAIFHPSTWSTSSYCYLEDLFVAKTYRGSGAANVSTNDGSGAMARPGLEPLASLWRAVVPGIPPS